MCVGGNDTPGREYGEKVRTSGGNIIMHEKVRKAEGSGCIYCMMGNEGRGSEVETAGGGRQIAECLALGRGAFQA